MPNFVFTYRTAPDTTPTPESAQAWRSWFDDMGDHVADIGKPGLETAALGNYGPGTKLGGFSLISAADLEEALALAKGCPALARDGGVEIAELGEVPPRADS
jgi:YCII-related domain